VYAERSPSGVAVLVITPGRRTTEVTTLDRGCVSQAILHGDTPGLEIKLACSGNVGVVGSKERVQRLESVAQGAKQVPARRAHGPMTVSISRCTCL